MFNLKDKEILRSLAARIREISELPEMKIKKERLYNHNELKPDRPIVLCSPEGSWIELLPEGELLCEDKVARLWEREMRQTIFHFENIHDDSVVEPKFNVGWVINNNGLGVEIKSKHGEGRGSYKYEPPILELENDMKKLHFRQFNVDYNATKANIELAKEIFDGYLDVNVTGGYGWTLGLTWTAIELIGLENLMIYMYDEPENLHKLMKWLSDEKMHELKWLEKEGLLTLNNGSNYIASGGIGYSRELPAKDYIEGNPTRLKDLWGFAESQETVGISPEMFGEFVFPYQLPLLKEFGLNCYGCCEPVEGRWKYIKQIPNLRRVSISPWCNQEIMAENLGKNYIFSRKPNPSLLCVGYAEDEIRKELRHTLEITKGCVVELIMKDTHTVQNNKTRHGKWVKTAYEEIERIYG